MHLELLRGREKFPSLGGFDGCPCRGNSVTAVRNAVPDEVTRLPAAKGGVPIIGRCLVVSGRHR